MTYAKYCLEDESEGKAKGATKAITDQGNKDSADPIADSDWRLDEYPIIGPLIAVEMHSCSHGCCLNYFVYVLLILQMSKLRQAYSSFCLP